MSEEKSKLYDGNNCKDNELGMLKNEILDTQYEYNKCQEKISYENMMFEALESSYNESLNNAKWRFDIIIKCVLIALFGGVTAGCYIMSNSTNMALLSGVISLIGGTFVYGAVIANTELYLKILHSSKEVKMIISEIKRKRNIINNFKKRSVELRSQLDNLEIKYNQLMERSNVEDCTNNFNYQYSDDNDKVEEVQNSKPYTRIKTKNNTETR